MTAASARSARGKRSASQKTPSCGMSGLSPSGKGTPSAVTCQVAGSAERLLYAEDGAGAADPLAPAGASRLGAMSGPVSLTVEAFELAPIVATLALACPRPLPRPRLIQRTSPR